MSRHERFWEPQFYTDFRKVCNGTFKEASNMPGSITKKSYSYILKHISLLLYVRMSVTKLLIWAIPKWNNRLGLLASIKKGKSGYNLGSQICIIKLFLFLGILNLLGSSWYCLNYPFRYLNMQVSQIRKRPQKKMEINKCSFDYAYIC